MVSEDVTFAGADGTRLRGTVDRPQGRVRGWAVFAHCFTCSRDSHAASRISRALAQGGIGVLRYDFAGLGESEGDLEDATFTSDVADLVAAAAYLREQGGAPQLLLGHSLGGAAVLAAAGQVEGVRAVVTLNAPAEPMHVARLVDPATDELRRTGRARVRIGERSFLVRQQMLDDLAAQPQQERVGDLGAALLVLHAPRDETVGVDNARQIFDWARHPKAFVAVDGADHLLSRRADAEWVADLVAAWSSRYLAHEAPRPEEDEDPEDGVVVVRETGEGDFTQEVRAGRHRWLADEPPEVPGGTDLGPTPYDHLLAGLGACTAMTMRMYARRKKIPLGRVTVRLSQRNVHADDLTACVDGGEGCVRQFVREITLEGELDDDQRERLLLIADKCPVHRTLERGVEVVTELTG